MTRRYRFSFILTIVIVTTIALCVDESNFVNDREIEEEEYVSAYITSHEKPDTLCDLPKEKKMGICKMILEQDKYTENLKIHFNKAAAFHLVPDCETKLLTFQAQSELNNVDPGIQQDMFPCYGRHNPTRTRWNKDDYFNTIYVSGGPENDWLFVYFRTAGPAPVSDTYSIRDLLMHAEIARIPLVKVTEDELNRELKSIRRISFNPDVKEIERNYIRETITEEKSRPIPDPICDLNTERKLWLCKTILTRDLYVDEHNWTINEHAFRTLSVECEENVVELEHNSNYNRRTKKQRMFPCYGKSAREISSSSAADYRLTAFYLSAGFRQNSVIVYRGNTKNDATYVFYEFVENVSLELLSNEMNVVDDVTELENLYIELFIRAAKFQPNTLCDLPKERKLAICGEILKLEKGIYFNEVAAFHLTPDCVERSLTFETAPPAQLSRKQEMFPCYGRDNPIRTNWNIDDYFDDIYVSGGTEDDSVLVYIHEKTSESDIYRIRKLVTEVGIDYLESVYVSENRADEESKSIRLMAYNGNREQIEINYVREVIKTDNVVTDTFCDLPKDRKLILCRVILQSRFLDLDWVLNEDLFFSEPSECETNTLKFRITEDYNALEIKQKMFPCYGKSSNGNENHKYYLSGGYRKNSVLVYERYSQSEFHIGSFFENVYLGLCHATLRSIVDFTKLEVAYIESYMERENKPNTLCDLPRPKKLAICYAIFEHFRIRNEIRIFFNKIESSRRSMDCVKNPLTFRNAGAQKYQGTKQEMFPCYGRHDPIRSDSSEDYAVDSFYVSGGPEYDSLFVYIFVRSVRIENDLFGFYELITDAGVDQIPLLNKIYDQELVEESKTFEQLYVSKDAFEIELFYGREIISKRTPAEPDPVCDLPPEKKLTLCKLVETLYPYEHTWRIDEAAFGRRSTDCAKKIIRFQVVRDFDNDLVYRKMYPCYGILENNAEVALFYLCEGYRKNSVIAFKTDDGTEDISIFVASIENLNLLELESSKINLPVAETSHAQETSS